MNIKNRELNESRASQKADIRIISDIVNAFAKFLCETLNNAIKAYNIGNSLILPVVNYFEYHTAEGPNRH